MRLTFWNVALVPVCRRWVESSGYHSWHQPDLVGKASIKGISGKMAWAFPRFSLISVCVCTTHYPASSIEFLQARYGGPHPILALRWRRQITGGQAHLWPVQASRDTGGKGELWAENRQLYCTDQGVLRAGKMYNWPHHPLLERTWSPQACWPVDSPFFRPTYAGSWLPPVYFAFLNSPYISCMRRHLLLIIYLGRRVWCATAHIYGGQWTTFGGLFFASVMCALGIELISSAWFKASLTLSYPTRPRLWSFEIGRVILLCFYVYFLFVYVCGCLHACRHLWLVCSFLQVLPRHQSSCICWAI